MPAYCPLRRAVRQKFLLLGPTPDDQLTRSLELPKLVLDLGPGRFSLRLIQPGEHLVQRSEGLPLEADSLGRRGHPQRCGDDLGLCVAQTGSFVGFFQYPGVAQGERSRLAG